MRPKTKRRLLFVFGFAMWGCVAMLPCASSVSAQGSDAPRMTGANSRQRQWVTADPLAESELQPDAPTPVVKATPIGDTVSVRSMQLPAGAIKEFHRSEKCVGSGDFSGAAQHLQKALRVDPKFVEAHNNLGASYLELSRYQDAIAEFEAAIALDEKMVAPYRNMSLGFFLMRRYVDAEAAARRALAVSPDHKPARYSLGRALAAQGSVSPEAERLLRESLEDFPEARLSLAQVLMNRCANLDAAAELRAYLASNTVDPDTQRRVQVWIERSLKGQVASGCGQAKPAA
jgi:tetratricopeptide (TPR) repeat protein